MRVLVLVLVCWASSNLFLFVNVLVVERAVIVVVVDDAPCVVAVALVDDREGEVLACLREVGGGPMSLLVVLWSMQFFGLAVS